MAYRAPLIDSVERDRRQQRYAGARTIAERFPQAAAFAIELRFEDPSGPRPAGFRQIYLPGMQAYFDIRCPIVECSGGGFDLDGDVAAMLANPRHAREGSRCCAGARAGDGGSQRCGVQLHFRLTAAD